MVGDHCQYGDDVWGITHSADSKHIQADFGKHGELGLDHGVSPIAVIGI